MPIHYQPDSPAGPFWSVTRYEDIVAIERDTETFSSEPSIAIIDPEPDMILKMFIAMDRPSMMTSAAQCIMWWRLAIFKNSRL